MTPRTPSTVAAVAGALMLAACADDPTRPVAAGPRAPVVPRAGITIIPVLTASIVDLGTFGPVGPGLRNESRAYGINDSGFVTGKATAPYTPAAAWDDPVFRWHASTGLVHTGVYGVGYDINLSNTIVGRSYSVGWINGQGFRVDAAGVVTRLGWLPGSWAGTALGINNGGSIVGFNHDSEAWTGYNYVGVRYDAGTLAVSGYAPGAHGSQNQSGVSDINGANQIVGSATDSGGHLHAGFRYTPGVGYEYIKPWSATVRVSPHDINDAGEVAGSERSPFGMFPFRWSPASGFTYLNTSGAQGEAYGINASGFVVGRAASAPAFWEPDGTFHYLPRLAGGLATTCGVNDCAAQAINSQGEIAGYDRTASGEVHAVVWRLRWTFRVIIRLYPYEPIVPPIRLGAGGLIPLALISTPDFDAREIKPGLLRLGNDDGVDTPVALDKYRRPMVSYEDVDKDGDLDLLLHFDQAALEKNKDLTSETTALYLTADLGGGRQLQGAQKVEVAR